MERLTRRTGRFNTSALKGNGCSYAAFSYSCDSDCEEARELLNNALEKLAEYEDLEEQGKLLKLPCAVGDKIYLPSKYVGKVIDFDIVEICIFKEESVFIDDSGNEYLIDDFGKSIFITHEEAETALKEL